MGRGLILTKKIKNIHDNIVIGHFICYWFFFQNFFSKFDDNSRVREVFRYIGVDDEILAEQSAPDYNLIITKLDEAINNQIDGPSLSSRG